MDDTEGKTEREKKLEYKIARLAWVLQGKDEEAISKAVDVFRRKVRTLCPCISRSVVEDVLKAVCSVVKEEDFSP